MVKCCKQSWMFTVISGYHVILELSRVKIHPRVWPVHVPQVDGAVSAVGELIESYGVSYHQFADDTQLLVSMDSTNATPAIDRLAHCSAAVRLWFLQNGLHSNSTLTSQHPCPAPVSCQHHHCRRCWNHSAGRIEAQVAWRDHWFQSAVRLSREKRCKGLQLQHSRSAPRAQSTDWRRRPDSRVQHHRFQTGILQCDVEWRTGDDFWQTTARPEQPGQSRLPEPGSHRCQAAALLATLASGEAASHL